MVQITPASPNPLPPDRIEVLREKSKQLEAAFLSEMLSHAGLEATEGTFSGGIGEEQFSSFLRQEQAKAMVDKGGIGLAEMIFRSLTEGEDAK